jgi:hypothetical protein
MLVNLYSEDRVENHKYNVGSMQRSLKLKTNCTVSYHCEWVDNAV